MKIQDMLNAPYLVPTLLRHIDNPTDETRNMLQHMGVSLENFIDAKRIRTLLDYHDTFMRQGQADYASLREGLQEYWYAYLYTMFQQLNIVNQEGFLLDYGCGAGQVSTQFLIDNPDAHAVRVDKEITHPDTMQIDFEEWPDWYLQYVDQFNWVMLSEVLHCKSRIVQRYLIDSSYHMLVQDGSLLIVENQDPLMVWRINQIKGTNYKPINRAELDILLKGRFKLKNHLTIQQHHVYNYVRIS
jgi:hypothetical protein